jgi:hypothetical protein
MVPITRVLIVAGFALATGIGMNLTAYATFPQKNRAEVKNAINKMAENPGDETLAEAISRKFLNEDVMGFFKPTQGQRDKDNIHDSIELTIIDLAKDKKGFVKDTMTRFGPDLIKVARQTQAIAEVNAFYAPREKMGNKEPKDWKQFNDEMKAGAAELATAAEARDAAEVKAAANRLNNACVKCHEIFRD